MALRDNPYLPLYVQDFLTDEKLSCCALSTQGAYIRIMCALHKSETYGGILFKQIPKQNFTSIQYFAFILAKQTGLEILDMQQAIEELLFYGVLKIEQRDGIDFLFQKRMIKDFKISEARKKTGKKGGEKSVLLRQNTKQNPEYKNEDENENKGKGVQGENGKREETSCEVIDELSFENVWEMYGKKGNKKTSSRRWNDLSNKSKQLAITHIPRYVESTPNVQYRKNFETYINQEAWNDEIILANDEKNRITITEDGRTMGDSYSGNGKNTFRTDAEKRRYEREMLKQMAEAVLQQSKT